MLIDGRRAHNKENENGRQNEEEGVSWKRFMNGRHIVDASDSCECECDNMRPFFGCAGKLRTEKRQKRIFFYYTANANFVPRKRIAQTTSHLKFVRISPEHNAISAKCAVDSVVNVFVLCSVWLGNACRIVDNILPHRINDWNVYIDLYSKCCYAKSNTVSMKRIIALVRFYLVDSSFPIIQLLDFIAGLLWVWQPECRMLSWTRLLSNSKKIRMSRGKGFSFALYCSGITMMNRQKETEVCTRACWSLSSTERERKTYRNPKNSAQAQVPNRW